MPFNDWATLIRKYYDDMPKLAEWLIQDRLRREKGVAVSSI